GSSADGPRPAPQPVSSGAPARRSGRLAGPRRPRRDGRSGMDRSSFDAFVGGLGQGNERRGKGVTKRPPPPMRPEPPARASSLWRYASTIDAGGPSLMIRDILYRKPGKVRPMVEKFVAMAKLGEKNGMGRMRVYTDVSAEQYWTVVSGIEVE